MIATLGEKSDFCKPQIGTAPTMVRRCRQQVAHCGCECRAAIQAVDHTGHCVEITAERHYGLVAESTRAGVPGVSRLNAKLSMPKLLPATLVSAGSTDTVNRIAPGKSSEISTRT